MACETGLGSIRCSTRRAGRLGKGTRRMAHQRTHPMRARQQRIDCSRKTIGRNNRDPQRCTTHTLQRSSDSHPHPRTHDRSSISNRTMEPNTQGTSAMKQEWVCPKCGDTYPSPLALQAVSCSICTRKNRNKLQWMQLQQQSEQP